MGNAGIVVVNFLVSVPWKFLTTKEEKLNFCLQTASEVKSNPRFEIYGSNST